MTETPGAPLRQALTFLTRACLTCGRPERNAEGKQLYWQDKQPMPLVRCEHCGSSNVFVNGYAIYHVRREPEIKWERSRLGRPPRNRPPED